MTDYNRIVIGCVVSASNRLNSNLETEYLFRTLNQFGGKLSQAKKWACFIEEPHQTVRNVLEELGVTIKVIAPLDMRDPYSHKIRLLDEAIKEDIDYLVVLDTDIVVAGDFSSYIEGDSIKAKPANYDVLGMENWKILFEHFNLKFPNERIKTTASGVMTIPLFGSGVMIFPKKYLKILYEPYSKQIRTLCDHREEGKLPKSLPDLRRGNEVFALALTLSKLGITCSPLPLKMNYPTVKVSPDENPLSLKPLIIHHHHKISEQGNIVYSPYENINKIIDKINKFLKNEKSSDLRDSHILHFVTRDLRTEGNFSEMLRLLQDLPVDHYDSMLQFDLARAYQENKEYTKAVMRYTRALEKIYHAPFYLYSNRANCYHALGQISNAVYDLKKALELDPGNQSALKRLSILEEQK